MWFFKRSKQRIAELESRISGLSSERDKYQEQFWLINDVLKCNKVIDPDTFVFMKPIYRNTWGSNENATSLIYFDKDFKAHSVVVNYHPTMLFVMSSTSTAIILRATPRYDGEHHTYWMISKVAGTICEITETVAQYFPSVEHPLSTQANGGKPNEA